MFEEFVSKMQPGDFIPVLAIALSVAVFAGWQYFVGLPAMKADQAKQALLSKEAKEGSWHHPRRSPVRFFSFSVIL